MTTTCEGVDVVAVVDRENEPSTGCSCSGNHHARCGGQSAEFVDVRWPNSEESVEEHALCEWQEHHHRSEGDESHEQHVGRIEDNGDDEPHE